MSDENTEPEVDYSHIVIDDEWDVFGESFEAAADIDPDELGDDPFNFGDREWAMRVVKVGPPKVGKKGGVGVYVYFEMQGKYAGKKVGKYFRIPPPKKIQEMTGIVFSPKSNANDYQVVFDWYTFLFALGFDRSEFSFVKPPAMVGSVFQARCYGREEQGFWKVNFGSPKRYVPSAHEDGSDDGLDEFSREGTGSSAADELEAALTAGANAK